MNYSFYLTNGTREYSDGATANEAFDKTGYSENVIDLIVSGETSDGDSLEWQPETNTWQAKTASRNK